MKRSVSDDEKDERDERDDDDDYIDLSDDSEDEEQFIGGKKKKETRKPASFDPTGWRLRLRQGEIVSRNFNII